MNEEKARILRARAEFDQTQAELREEVVLAWRDHAVRDEVARVIDRLCRSESATGMMVGFLARETWVSVGLQEREKALGLVSEVED